MQNKLELFLISDKKKEISSVEISSYFLSWGTRTRTRKGRTRICSVTITPYPNDSCNFYLRVQRYYFFWNYQNFSKKNLQNNKKIPPTGGISYLFLVLSINCLDLFADEIHVVLQFLNLAVHLVDETVALLR